jgi:hypothetical protein
MQRNWKLPLIALLLCLAAFLLFSPLLSALHLTYFAPLLVISCYIFEKITCLWLALGIGLILDLYGSHEPFALLAAVYCVSCWLLYTAKPLFFEDSLSTIPILTALFSMISTIIYAFALSFFSGNHPLSLEWMVSDVLLMSLVDAIYAVLWIGIPLRFFPRTLRRPDNYILRKRKQWVR